MYWTSSKYSIQNVEDLLLLQNIFQGVPGAFKFVGNCLKDEEGITAVYSRTPFISLEKWMDEMKVPFPIEVQTQLPGPHSAAAVSKAIKKIEKENDEELKGYDLELLKQWADAIDEIVKNEMHRKDDLYFNLQIPNIEKLD
jgi:hypothetical protein